MNEKDLSRCLRVLGELIGKYDIKKDIDKIEALSKCIDIVLENM